MFLTGVGPLLAWRKSTLVNLRDQFLIPVVAAAVIGAAVLALGVRVWSSGICFMFAGFVFGTIGQEFWRGARVRQQTTGTDVFTAFVGLVGRNKRRYGGYLVHVGIVLLFLGFAGEGFKQQKQAHLKPGQQVVVGDYTARLDAVRVTDDERKQAITGHFTILKGGVEITKMYPARWYFRKHEDQPTTEVAIRRTLTEDFYLVMPKFDLADQSADVDAVVNPLVNWVWFGFGIIAMGTFIALLPETAFAFAVAAVPARAATTAILLIGLSLSSEVVAGQTVDAQRFSALETSVREKVMCTCSCRRSLAKCGMTNCGGEASQMAKLHQFISEGNRDEESVLAAFVKDRGAYDVLMSPPDSGFNRMAWLLPYLLAVGGLFAIVVAARRWSHAARPAMSTGTPLDPALDARLDDELRNLD
jgi:cytochrome c-type biogenesis protein CcmF